MHHSWRVVAGVAALTGRVCNDGRTQAILRESVRSTDALIDHFFYRQIRVPTCVHTDFHEGDHDARVLADGSMTLGAHTRIGKDLRNGVPRRGALLHLVRPTHRRDEVR